MTQVRPVLGIDFGTTNSSMAWLNPQTGRAEIIKNAEGSEKMPSLVYFGDGETLVGAAVEALLDDLKNHDEATLALELPRIIRSIKRSLLSPARIALPDGRDVRPVDVVAAILGKLKRDAETHLDATITSTVITCPAAFSTPQRRKIEEAAHLAGFTEVALLEEPVAAALAFARDARNTGKSILVYDFGAGTFDLAVIVREDDGTFRVAVEPDGDAQCGGDDFDQALYEYWDKLAQRELGRRISRNCNAVDLLFLHECRAQKVSLSMLRQCTFSRLLSGGARLKHTIDRGTFENLIRVQIEKTVRKTEQMLQRAKAAGYPVESVVLIGGASNVPLVREMLRTSLPVAPREWGQKEVAVALGAAYRKAIQKNKTLMVNAGNVHSKTLSPVVGQKHKTVISSLTNPEATRRKILEIEATARFVKDWCHCAEVWVKEGESASEADRCLKKAESLVTSARGYCECAEAWMQVLSREAEAKRCLSLAELCSDKAWAFCRCAQAWIVCFQSHEAAQRCLQKAESLIRATRPSIRFDDWCELAKCWKNVLKNEQAARRCLQTMEYDAGKTKMDKCVEVWKAVFYEKRAHN